ncbi:hypothetical protein LP52_03390 [Streptomonospora alba]|uniref:Uncharacterized protein n=1 Tax=Streptomonospora alba TaxID=183763 RepID=A0A0C2JM21_9ACTN|nr:hypothetical protein [Streptomonospora alba]KII00006.1 hypothetical protein LP52_03390 [Streptomonospora alba]
MILLRAWAAGAGAWLAWAVASALLHLWLLPLGALETWHLRLPWLALTTLIGYTLATLAAGLVHPRTGRGRRLAAVLALPILGAAVETTTLARNGLDVPALLTVLAALGSGTFAGHRLTRAGNWKPFRRPMPPLPVPPPPGTDRP